MVHRLILKDFRIIDESMDILGSVVIEKGTILEVLPGPAPDGADLVIDGGMYAGRTGVTPVLMPAFVDLHAHFRDPGSPGGEGGGSGENSFPESWFLKETLESASLAAAAGGYGTVICMANTKPAIDTPQKAAGLKARSDVLGLIDLYPVLSLTRNMEGRELSGIVSIPSPGRRPPWGEPSGTSLPPYVPRFLSEDGRDVADDGIFRAALIEARRLGIPVSCHCDAGGGEAEAAKKAGQPREDWSRLEENNAVRRAIALGREAGCHIHIAHVSTKEAVDLVRKTKKDLAGSSAAHSPFFLTCEAAPHHIALTEKDARRLGAESHGRVNPPLRTEEDRRAVIAAILDGTIDTIATDHAPHTEADKAAGAPGFTGLETAFGVCFTELVQGDPERRARRERLDLSGLSALMSAAPARLLGFGQAGPAGRGRIAPGFRADLVIADTGTIRTVDPGLFKSRGRNSPFAGRELRGTILMTLHRGRIVFQAPGVPVPR
jgi:dihydroorotase